MKISMKSGIREERVIGLPYRLEGWFFHLWLRQRRTTLSTVHTQQMRYSLGGKIT